MSHVFYEWKAGIVSMIVVVCVPLMAMMKDQIEQLKKIGVAEMAIGIEEKAVKNWTVQGCV